MFDLFTYVCMAVFGLCSGTRDLLLWRASSSLWRIDLVPPQHVGSCFPDQGVNQRPLRCKTDS